MVGCSVVWLVVIEHQLHVVGDCFGESRMGFERDVIELWQVGYTAEMIAWELNVSLESVESMLALVVYE